MCSVGLVSSETAGQGSMLMLFLFRTVAISLQHEALHYHTSILQAHTFEGKNSFKLQNLFNVTLSIEVTLHNNEICFPSTHNATPYHNTPTSKSVPLNETVISRMFPSSSKNLYSTVMMTNLDSSENIT